MDNKSDQTITFDENGICNYCRDAFIMSQSVYFPNEIGKRKFEEMVKKIKGSSEKYDCIMGLSGGLDSTYLAYLGFKHGLRILAVHIDDGFDAPVAVENINKIAKACNIDVVYEKPDPEQFYGLTKAFMKAGVPNIAIPQDNLIIGYLYKHAKSNGIKYYLSGGNFSLESILQQGNTHSALDKTHIKAINKLYGETPINKLSIISDFERKIANKFIFQIQEYRPLNWINYRKDQALEELKEFCDYNYYEGKHYESIFTRFLQTYYLPHKFKVDKRTSHYSSLIVTNQMSRDEAIEELRKPLYNDVQMKEDIKFILNKINMSESDFDSLMNESPKKHTDYKVSKWKYITKINKKIKGY